MNWERRADEEGRPSVYSPLEEDAFRVLRIEQVESVISTRFISVNMMFSWITMPCPMPGVRVHGREFLETSCLRRLSLLMVIHIGCVLPMRSGLISRLRLEVKFSSQGASKRVRPSGSFCVLNNGPSICILRKKPGREIHEFIDEASQLDI